MRRVLVAGLLIMGIVVLPAGAAAGGGNWLRLDERYVVVGQEVTASNRYVTRAEAARGPYYLYLFSKGHYDPPLRAFEEAPILGRVRILWPPEDGWKHRGMPQNPVLRARFTVPEMATGEYVLMVCDNPCSRKIDWIGGTQIRVVESPGVARLHERTDALRSKFSNYVYRDRIRDRQALGQLRRSLHDDISGMETAIEEAGRPQAIPSPIPGRIALGASGVALLVAVLGILTMRRRLREERFDWDVLLTAGERSPREEAELIRR